MSNTFIATVISLFFFIMVTDSHASDNKEAIEILNKADEKAGSHNASPVRRIQRNYFNRYRGPSTFNIPSIDGFGNNRRNPEMNAADTHLLRLMSPDYSDQVSALAGADRPSARDISNKVNAQPEFIQNPKLASDFLWQWGQFLDHDIDLSEGTVPPEFEPITVPTGDPSFDPNGAGDKFIAFNRTIYDIQTGTDASNPRQQINEITGWIDASNVYGSDDERAMALRTLDGTGGLKTSDGNLLPFNTSGLPNAGGNSAELFLAGDLRANEQIGLTAMHTLFVREHNRLARDYRRKFTHLDDEGIYQLARREVMALMQAITYNEFIPVLLGRHALAPYEGYKRRVDSSIANSFSTAAFRLGHSLLSAQLLRLDRNHNEITSGHLPLRNAFFSPSQISDHGGIEPILRGLASQVCQNLDAYVIDDVRNFLFGNPGEGGFDLASLNIQRGRDHGLPGYNDTREALGLGRVTRFDQVSSDPQIQSRLADAYISVDQIDLWVGGLAEDHVQGALVGEVFFAILKDQFERLRDGDRFWYERSLDYKTLQRVKRTRLSHVIRRNTDIGGELQSNVFIVPRYLLP